MNHRMLHAALAAIVMAICLSAATAAHAQYYGPPGWPSPEPNNYATPPGPEGLTAAMYPCPRPTPPLVGQTYITYTPFNPQEYMYLHHDTYLTGNGAGQWTTTSVTYGHHYHLWPHPSLRNQAPGLHTPAAAGCAIY